jgi:hypothetical protein
MRVNRYRSSSMEINQRVPQGSALGPLLYLLHINDIPVNIHDENLVMCADDFNVFISGSDESLIRTKIDRVVAELKTWFNRNNLVTNAGKTGIMLFHNKHVF